MPYWLVIISLIPILLMHARDPFIDRVEAHEDATILMEVMTIGNELSALGTAIESRKKDAEVVEWECEMFLGVCTGNYNRVVSDDGYVDGTSWKGELIPQYLAFLRIDEKYIVSLSNETDIIRICIEIEVNDESREIFKGVGQLENNQNVYVNADCFSDIRYTDNDIDSEAGNNMYVISKINKVDK